MKKIFNILNEGEELTIKDVLGGCLFLGTFFTLNWLLGFIEYVIK